MISLIEYVEQSLSNEPVRVDSYKVGQYCGLCVTDMASGKEYHVRVKATSVNESGWPGFMLEEILEEANLNPSDDELVTLHYALESL